MNVSGPSGRAKQQAHINYILRDGVTKDGEKTEGFGNVSLDELRDFEKYDKQFRMILSPNDTYPPVDLEDYTRQYIDELEVRTGFRLEYFAVPHYNTDNPHVHLIITDRDQENRSVRFSREQMSHDLRDAARDVLTSIAGQRTSLQKNIEGLDQSQLYLTKTDEKIQKYSDVDGHINVDTIMQRDRYKLEKRLKFLKSIGVATQKDSVYQLDDDLKDRLTAYRRTHIAQKEGAKFGPLPENTVGYVLKEGTLDELSMKKFQIIETVSGDKHYHESQVPFSTQSKAVIFEDGKLSFKHSAALLSREGGFELYAKHFPKEAKGVNRGKER